MSAAEPYSKLALLRLTEAMDSDHGATIECLSFFLTESRSPAQSGQVQDRPPPKARLAWHRQAC
jgi:hypothetical protein